MSAVLREALLGRLQRGRFDVLIIGGGIVGASIARDAAMRGLTVALIEQGDFASGTSSKTSKLIHGGLRYLEHGHLRLVWESLRERHTFRTIAPGLVYPLSILLPVYAGDARGAMTINLGLWCYDLLAMGRGIPACAAGAAGRRGHRMLSPRSTRRLEPGVRGEGLRAAGLYADCGMDDARLCLATVLQAAEFGAVCANYVRLRTLLKANGRVCGAVAEDLLSGASFEMQAEVIVNATGPWTDRIRRLSETDAPERLAPTKGSHLLVPRLAREALFVQARADGRRVFILPFGDCSLVGTTEQPVDGSLEGLQASEDEVGYLLGEVNRLFPDRRLDGEDVLATFAGARPLLAFSGSSTRASREHRIDIDRGGLISVLGGKFTTARLMAQQAVDVVVARLRRHTDRCLTDQVSLLETVHPVSMDRWREVTQRIDPDLLARLLVRYGVGTFRILHLVSEEPSLLQPVCPHHEDTQAELVHALRHEWACTITDVLARRTRIAWSSCQGLDALSTVGDLFERYAALTRPQVERQVDAYHQFLAATVAFRRGRTPSQLVS